MNQLFRNEIVSDQTDIGGVAIMAARSTMIRECWAGVMNAASRNATNARSEGTNSKIQWIKRMACGYRNRSRFHNAIYFHLGDLDLYPISLKSTHTKV